MPSKSNKNNNGKITLSQLYEAFQNFSERFENSITDIKSEIQQNRTEFTDKISEIKERMVKMETQPLHENFQQKFCPNTKDIAELKETGTKGLRDYIFVHQEDHKQLNEKLEKLKDQIDAIPGLFDQRAEARENIWEEREARQRRYFIGILLTLVAIAIPAIIDLIRMMTGG
jgi:seryl-tRNA(Sec) selenium transferase